MHMLYIRVNLPGFLGYIIQYIYIYIYIIKYIVYQIFFILFGPIAIFIPKTSGSYCKKVCDDSKFTAFVQLDVFKQLPSIILHIIHNYNCCRGATRT